MHRGTLEYPAQLNEPVDPNDRFAYGWRYVVELQPDGSERTAQVPLTLDDVLHPKEGDFRVENDPHLIDLLYLRDVFDRQIDGVPGAVVLSDCRIAWDEAGEYGHGPDNAVIFDVRERKPWGTFNVVQEGTRPKLIVEITSPSTRSNDLFNKVCEYAEQKVLHYVIADAREKAGARRIKLIDYRLGDDGEYEVQPLGINGRVWLEEVKLWLGAEDGRLVCYDSEGMRKETYVELDHALREEKQAREALEARLRLLEEKLQAGGTLNGQAKAE